MGGGEKRIQKLQTKWLHAERIDYLLDPKGEVYRSGRLLVLKECMRNYGGCPSGGVVVVK
jgi:hypothetical protein